MRTVQINFAEDSFARRFSRFSLFSLLLVLVLLVALILLGTRLFRADLIKQTTQNQLSEKQMTLAKGKRQAERLTKESADADLPKARIAALNQAIGQLNLPWTDLLDNLQAAEVPEVSVLRLEPEVENKLLKMSVEAKTLEAMFTFVQKLNRQPMFHDASLLKHEVNEQDVNKPIRFQLQVKWTTAVLK